MLPSNIGTTMKGDCPHTIIFLSEFHKVWIFLLKNSYSLQHKFKLALVLIGGSLSLSLMGVGVKSNHNILICESNRKCNKITHCVDFFRKSFEDMSTFAINRMISSCKYQGQQFPKFRVWSQKSREGGGGKKC